MVSGLVSNGNFTTGGLSVAGEYRPASLRPSRQEITVIFFALAAAIMLHAAAILSVLVEWSSADRVPPPREIPIELVMEEAPKAEQTEAAPPKLEYRESGGDPNLAPGRAADPAPQAVPPVSPPSSAEQAAPAPELPQTDQIAGFGPPLRKPAPPSPRQSAQEPPSVPMPQPKAEPRPVEPKAPAAPVSRLTIAGQGGGDVYLNELRARIEAARTYPAVAAPMKLAGVALYELRVRRDGEVLAVLLRRTTGAGVLDREGQEIVRRAGPFPPVPADLTGDPLVLMLQLYLGPDR